MTVLGGIGVEGLCLNSGPGLATGRLPGSTMIWHRNTTVLGGVNILMR
jgi:hypothetical protein